MAQFDSMIADLKKVADEHEQAARLLFVVCGKPEGQDAFELAWSKEDFAWYDQWMTLNVFIKMMADHYA